MQKREERKKAMQHNLDLQLNRSMLGTKMQELSGDYILLEQFYMNVCIEKAIQSEQRDEDGSLTRYNLQKFAILVRILGGEKNILKFFLQLSDRRRDLPAPEMFETSPELCERGLRLRSDEQFRWSVARPPPPTSPDRYQGEQSNIWSGFILQQVDSLFGT